MYEVTRPCKGSQADDGRQVMIQDRIYVIEPCRDRYSNVVVIPSRKDEES